MIVSGVCSYPLWWCLCQEWFCWVCSSSSDQFRACARSGVIRRLLKSSSDSKSHCCLRAILRISRAVLNHLYPSFFAPGRIINFLSFSFRPKFITFRRRFLSLVALMSFYLLFFLVCHSYDIDISFRIFVSSMFFVFW